MPFLSGKSFSRAHVWSQWVCTAMPILRKICGRCAGAGAFAEGSRKHLQNIVNNGSRKDCGVQILTCACVHTNAAAFAGPSCSQPRMLILSEVQTPSPAFPAFLTSAVVLHMAQFHVATGQNVDVLGPDGVWLKYHLEVLDTALAHPASYEWISDGITNWINGSSFFVL